MNKSRFLRSPVLSLFPAGCLLFAVSTPMFAQRPYTAARFQPIVLDGSTRAGWYSFPGQSPKLKFYGSRVRITSGLHSTVLLSRGGEAAGSGAEVSLDRPPISTSSVSGLAVMSDARHAMVIGLEAGNVVLWQLDPDATRVIARQRVNSSAPLQFRVAGMNGSDFRFFWRHAGDAAWHPLGVQSSEAALAGWREPLRYGLLLDGPQGSQVTFSNYRSFNADVAAVNVPSNLTASLVRAQ